MTGRLYSEHIVGNGSRMHRGLPHGAYNKKSGAIDPGWWESKATPPAWASAVIFRLPFGVLDPGEMIPKPGRPGESYNNPYAMPARMLAEGNGPWIQAAYRESKRAQREGHPPFWYHGIMGIDALDATADPIARSLAGTHIIDNANGSDPDLKLMVRGDWGEPFPEIDDPYPRPDNHPPHVMTGSYCFAGNLRKRGGDRRLAAAMRLAGFFKTPAIVVCHTADDAAWLLSDSIAGRGVPNWRAMLVQRISLAFRGGDGDVDAFLGGKLDELVKVAGEASDE